MTSPDYWAGNRPGYIAAHECGHALAFWAQGIPLDYVTIIGHGLMPRPHTQPVDVNEARLGQKLLINASGVISGFWRNNWEFSDVGIAELLIGSADGCFETIGALSRRASRIPRAGLIGPAEDLELAVWLMGGKLAAYDHAIRYWRECEQFLASVMLAVAAITPRLIERGELPGAEVASRAAAAMAQQPTAWIPAWTAEE